MFIQPDADLSLLNTLRLPARAEFLARPRNEDELAGLLSSPSYRSLPRSVIGEGSNLVLAGDIPGLVIRPDIRGVRAVEHTADHVLVEVGAGENWDRLVAYTLEQEWYGLENLSLIPGTVGAAPYQNIGAYGVELADRCAGVVAVDLHTGAARHFAPEACRFGYRDSLFKSIEPGRWLVTYVRLKLAREPALRLEYADLAHRLGELSPERRNPHGVRELVCGLRRSKLPDPASLPNVGSFFKNPVIDPAHYQRLLAAWPDIVAYPSTDGVKLAAGWLIEKAGWKGRREGHLGMHDRQALVLVNHGQADGAQVLAFAAKVAESVRECFGVTLEQEPVVLPRVS